MRSPPPEATDDGRSRNGHARSVVGGGSAGGSTSEVCRNQSQRHAGVPTLEIGLVGRGPTTSKHQVLMTYASGGRREGGRGLSQLLFGNAVSQFETFERRRPSSCTLSRTSQRLAVRRNWPALREQLPTWSPDRNRRQRSCLRNFKHAFPMSCARIVGRAATQHFHFQTARMTRDGAHRSPLRLATIFLHGLRLRGKVQFRTNDTSRNTVGRNAAWVSNHKLPTMLRIVGKNNASSCFPHQVADGAWNNTSNHRQTNNSSNNNNACHNRSNPRMHITRFEHAHTHTQTHTETHTHTHTRTHAHTSRQRDRQTHRHRHTHTNAHTLSYSHSLCFCFYCVLRQWRRGACRSDYNTTSAGLSGT